MRVTQQDIARISEVSQATVSRVLAGDERVDGQIRDRVLAVMNTHNYRPDVRARSLRQRKTHLIGLVIKREVGSLQDDPFFAMLIAEVVDALAGSPWHLCLDIAADTARQHSIYDELLRTRRVDGLILVESEASDERILRLQQDHFPFVLVGNAAEMPELHAIDNDNFRAAEIATSHLLEQGYRRIAFLAGPKTLTVTRDREAGYRNVVPEAIVAYTDFGAHSAREAAAQLLDAYQPDAILAMDDTMAMGVIQAARERILAIPQDLGVVGFNDTPLCDHVEGGLTSVNLQIGNMVQWAIRRLVAVIDDTSVLGGRQAIMGCELMVRGSSVRGKL